MATNNNKKEGEKTIRQGEGEKADELHTDQPLSEKDEVKEAEENTQKQQNKDR